MNKNEVKQIADKEVKAHEKRLHGKGYRAGGKTSLEMKKVGRGMAKVLNQRDSVGKVKKAGI
ncbi:MAG: hypothetical protein EBR82_39790 [Caulobacteraceae bacterium]|jgi:hypothetical protein|nr:hypothetical protein [Caulobacteraceae bacterium]